VSLRAGPDSVAYLESAQSLRLGLGLVTNDGPFVAWPPGFPLAVAALPLAPLLAVKLLNALALGFVAWGSTLWLLDRGLDSRRSLLGGAVVAIGSPVVVMASWVGSESLFIALTLGALLWLSRHAEGGKRGDLLLATALAGAACLTRYLGVVLVLVGLIRLGRRWRSALVWGCGSLTPLGIWLARNQAVTGTLTGPREASVLSVSDIAGRALYEMGRWVVPASQPFLAGPQIALGLVALAVLAWLARRDLAGLHALAYVMSLATLSALVHMDALSFRLMAPAFVPAALAAWPLVSGPSRFRPVLMAGVALWVSLALAKDVRHFATNDSLTAERYAHTELARRFRSATLPLGSR
jgi:hypothetical protein